MARVFFLLLLFTGLLSGPVGYSQGREDVRFRSAELDEASNTIIVRYSLISSKSSYEVDLYYSNDGGATFRGPVDKVRVSGDVGPGVLPGENNVIYWNYFYEDDEFTGKNLVFKITARETSDLQLMGPKAALYSMAVPGWGDSKVREGGNYGLITAGVWGMLGASIVIHSSAKQSYINYLQAPSAEEANTQFDKAQLRNGTSRVLGSVAIASWVVDVLAVYIKGKKNQKQGLVQLGRTEWNLTVNHVQGNPVGGLRVKF